MTVITVLPALISGFSRGRPFVAPGGREWSSGRLDASTGLSARFAWSAPGFGHRGDHQGRMGGCFAVQDRDVASRGDRRG